MQDWEKIYKEEGDVWKGKGGYLARMYPLVKENLKLLKKNNVKKILDLGCGTGRHALALAEDGFEIIAVDNSSTALHILNEKKKSLAIETIESDMAELPFVDDSFDAVLCTNVIHHAKLEKMRKTIHEIHRVLKKA